MGLNVERMIELEELILQDDFATNFNLFDSSYSPRERAYLLRAWVIPWGNINDCYEKFKLDQSGNNLIGPYYTFLNYLKKVFNYVPQELVEKRLQEVIAMNKYLDQEEIRKQ